MSTPVSPIDKELFRNVFNEDHPIAKDLRYRTHTIRVIEGSRSRTLEVMFMGKSTDGFTIHYTPPVRRGKVHLLASSSTKVEYARQIEIKESDVKAFFQDHDGNIIIEARSGPKSGKRLRKYIISDCHSREIAFQA
jgi:hypothetical protein